MRGVKMYEAFESFHFFIAIVFSEIILIIFVVFGLTVKDEWTAKTIFYDSNEYRMVRINYIE